MDGETAPDAQQTRFPVADVPATDDEVNDQELSDEVSDEVSDEDVNENSASASPSSSGSEIGDDEEPRRPYSHPIGSRHRLGLEVIAGDETPQDVSYDLVAVHGLSSRSRSAWMKRPQGPQYRSWLSDEFSGMPGHSGRVMLYGYDPGDRSGKNWTSYGIYKEAEALLEALLQLRGPEIRGKRRPIWFLSHDIGGVIVKAAMVIATLREHTYRDILNCTRSLVFFGYPHRYVTRYWLEDSISRLLLSMRQRSFVGNFGRAAKSLSQAIVEVNDAFVHTPLPTQVNLVNIIPSTKDTIFNGFMMNIGNPFERQLSINRSNRHLVREDLGTKHEFCRLPNLDWLTGDLPDHLHATLHQLLKQASPIYTYMKSETPMKAFPEIEGFTNSSDDRIVHLRCSPSHPMMTARVSQRVIHFLERECKDSQPLLYFKFDAHDLRFSSASSMLQTFVARLLFNRLKDSDDTIQRVAERLHLSGTITPYDLFYEFTYLREKSDFDETIYVLGCLDECDESALWFLSCLRTYLERTESHLRVFIITTKGTDMDEAVASELFQFPPGIVTSCEYEPPKPPSYDHERETSLLVQERPEFAWNNQHNAIRDLLSQCKLDEALCQLLIDWLKSALKPFESGARLFNEPISPRLVFETVLAETPEARRVWAQKILSWVLASLRPLRTNEFCRISDEVWARENNDSTPREPVRVYDAWSRAADALGYFGGLLVTEQGEIRFRHLDTRDWLLSQENSGNTEAWYRIGTEQERHGVVLETCLTYLCGERGEDATLWAEQTPYAIEFWTRHYQQAAPTEDVTNELFEEPSLLQRWIHAYRALPTPFLKPRPETSTPLPVAAHFGLQQVLQSLLAKPQSVDIKTYNQALVEAARVGNFDIVNAIMVSYPAGFQFNDDHLHEAVRAASFCGNPGVFRKLVDAIPLPPFSIPQRSSQGLKSESRDAQGDEHQNPGDEASRPEKPHDPFHWLAAPLLQASCLGLDDVISKLLSVGADPNPPQGTHLRDISTLHESAQNGHASSLKILIEGGADVNAISSVGSSPLFLAGSRLAATTLLDHGATIDLKSSGGFTALQSLAQWGDYLLLDTLLQRQNYREYLQESPEKHPVNLAAENGQRKCLEALLRHGFSPNIPNSEGETALGWAIDEQHIDQCRLLLENGADPDLTLEGGESPLHKSVFKDRLDIMQLLVDHEADIEKKEMPQQGWLRTPLQTAIDWGREDQVEYLLKQGASLNVQDSDNMWPIFAAARSGRTNMVRMLAEAKADVNSLSDYEKWTPAHAAYKFPETVELLMDLGADMTILTESWYTPLDLAISNGQRATIDVILAKSKTAFDFTLRGIRSALVSAVDDSYTEAIEAMLEAGADVNTTDATYEENKNESLLSSAMRLDDAAMMRKLLEFRPELELTSDEKSTPAHCISSTTPAASVRLFVNAGGRLDVLNQKGETPLQVAASRGNIDVFKYMLTKEAARSVLHVTPRNQMGTVMHVACMGGILDMVRMLLEHKFDVDFVCDGIWGTPLISAIVGPSEEDKRGQKRSLVELLLKEGADPSRSAGFYGYPINAACLTSLADIVQLLLERHVSIDVKDSCSRKPVHMACYNSLEVLNLLEVPDSDFAARDAVGRVPLHYAVGSGQVDLVEEVLARSERVGIDINVKDNDGWTPLFWATRQAPSWRRPREIDLATTDVVSLLLDKGADPAIEALGFDSPCPASQIAYYCHADAIGDLIVAKRGKHPPAIKRRGKVCSEVYCDCCMLQTVGRNSICEDCVDFTLCFKCLKSKSNVHSGHSFREDGEEWNDGGKDSNEKVEVLVKALGKIPSNNSDAEESDGGSSAEQFDNEIVG